MDMSVKSMLAVEPDTLPLPGFGVNQEYLMRLIDMVNDAVWLFDTELQLIAQNELAIEITGWSSSEITGHHIERLSLFSNNTPCDLCKLVKQAIEQQQPISFEKGVVIATKEQQPILIGGRISPVVDNGQLIGAICLFWQVTPDKDGAYLRFEFADMASHLLRTPLSFIQTSIDLLINAKLEVEDQQAMLRRMKLQTHRLKNVVNELLKMLRVETEGTQAYLEPVDLVPLVERVLNLIRYEQSHHTFELAAYETLPLVQADQTKTELILLNLLLSAVRRCRHEGQITVQLEQQAAEVVVSITDNGDTIPTKLLNKAFWQFYPVDNDNGKIPSTYQLGLYTTKQFVELQHGRIWAESQPGQGSSFSFSMPVLRGEKSQ
jgi:PAS domain S-box-containing protein